MAKIKSFGVTVSVATNLIGGLTDVSVPETEVTDIDITSHDSPNGFKEYVGGLKDGGIFTLNGNYDIANTGQAYLRNPANQGGAPVAVVVTFSDGSKATFNAVVKGYGVEIPLDDVATFSCSLRISGQPTYAAATP
jgi:predicted secreted protein